MGTTMQKANRLRVAFEEAKGPSLGCWQMIPGSNVSRALARTGEHGNMDGRSMGSSTSRSGLSTGFASWVSATSHGLAMASRRPAWNLSHREVFQSQIGRDLVSPTLTRMILTDSLSDAAMHEAVPAIAACGVSPIVRIPDNQGFMVKRALDSGAHGILVPLLYTVNDAEKLVKSAKFPPVGQRGFGSPFPHERFSPFLGSTDYLQQANDAILVMVQIETKEALENVDAIAAVPGIDVLFVGPFDLGNNIGHPIIEGKIHEDLHAAIKKVFEAARKAGKKVGIFCTSGEQSKGYVDMGFDMISCATDVMILQASVMGAVFTAKGLSDAPKLTGPYGK
ncbi:hypothetical protein JHW43_004316 [Diplocarpon mali]|nr:hypothetical protein JHW43_004316 [Diplocarpon mali]